MQFPVRRLNSGNHLRVKGVSSLNYPRYSELKETRTVLLLVYRSIFGMMTLMKRDPGSFLQHVATSVHAHWLIGLKLQLIIIAKNVTSTCTLTSVIVYAYQVWMSIKDLSIEIIQVWIMPFFVICKSIYFLILLNPSLMWQQWFIYQAFVHTDRSISYACIALSIANLYLSPYYWFLHIDLAFKIYTRANTCWKMWFLLIFALL